MFIKLDDFNSEEQLFIKLVNSSGSKHTHELRAEGIANPNNVVCCLIKKGLPIAKVQKPALDQFGNLRLRIAHYYFKEELVYV